MPHLYMSKLRGDSSEDYELHIRQGPERARVAGVKEKGRRPCGDIHY